MRKLILALSLALLSPTLACAQRSFKARLQKQMEDGGIIVLRDAEATDTASAVPSPTPPVSSTPALPLTPVTVPPIAERQDPDTFALSGLTPLPSGTKVRINGYRIQVYVGGNSRDAHAKALQMEGEVRAYFPDIPTYTRFISPRWICHVGDFRNNEEAVQFLTELRNKGGFDDAIVVKCKINSYVY